MTDTGFVIWNNYFDLIEPDGDTNNLKYNPTKSVEISAGTALNEINPFTTGWKKPVENGHTLYISNDIKIEKVGDGWVIIDSVKDMTNNPDYFNIGNGDKYLVTSIDGAYTFKKDGDVITETEVDVVGEYILSRVINRVMNIQKIVLYKYGDVDANNSIDVADIVAIKKLIESKATYSLAGTKGADINTDAVTNDFDAHALRYKIATGTLVEAKANTALNGVMPIIGYDGPYKTDTKDYLTNDIYAMVKDMGFNTVVANHNEIGTNYATSSKMLELAEANDLKVYLHNGYASDPTNKDNIYNKPEQLKSITAPYETYKSFAGYYVYDEPFSSDISGNTKLSLDALEPVMNQLKGYTNINNYLNLYPYISEDLNTSLGGSGDKVSYDNYKIYAEKALNNGADYLSYDLYLRGNGDKYNIITEEFYTNLSWARKIGLENNKPFYAFVQVGTDYSESNTSATKQKNLTTVQEMYLEANAALAMGAKGMSYYSLIQPEKFANWKNDGVIFGIGADSGTDIYRSGLINVNGEANHGEDNKTNYDYYSAAQKINGYIAKVDEVLMHSTNNGVITTDTKIQGYIGDAAITANDKKSGVVSNVSGSNVLVGCFDYFGKDAYMIVNTSTSASTTATLTFDGTHSLSSMTMAATDWAKSSSNTFSATLGAGESVLVVVD